MKRSAPLRPKGTPLKALPVIRRPTGSACQTWISTGTERARRNYICFRALAFVLLCLWFSLRCLLVRLIFVMKNLEKLSKIHQKSEEMVPRSVPKAISELGQQKGGHIKRKISSFLLIMLIFGHFWGPLKNRGGAKNDPKNSIRRLLGTPGRPKGEKKRFWMTLKKRIKNWLIFRWIFNGF